MTRYSSHNKSCRQDPSSKLNTNRQRLAKSENIKFSESIKGPVHTYTWCRHLQLETAKRQADMIGPDPRSNPSHDTSSQVHKHMTITQILVLSERDHKWTPQSIKTLNLSLQTSVKLSQVHSPSQMAWYLNPRIKPEPVWPDKRYR